MLILKLKSFSRWAKCENVTDKSLKKAINEIQKGLIDANLGGGLFKKRVARKGQGKRGGYRTLLAYQENERAVFMFGFPKSDLENIKDDQLKELKNMAMQYLNASHIEIQKLIANKILIKAK